MAQSWFSDPELLGTNFSVSYVCDNLSKAGDTVVYAHMDDAVVVNVAQTPCVASKLPIAEKSFIHQVRLCTLQDSVFIVVASDNGVQMRGLPSLRLASLSTQPNLEPCGGDLISPHFACMYLWQIFDDKGEQSLYELALKDALDAPEEGVAVFCRGIAAINSSQPSLIVGTSLGKLLVLGKEKSSKTTSAQIEFDLLETLREHKDSAISCIESAANGALVASSDDSGLILVHNPDDNFEVLHRIESSDPVTSMCFALEHWLVCGLLTGGMRMYKKDTFTLHTEVAAHTRAITAVDVHENHVASVSEDTFLNVWELSSSKSSGRVRLVSSHCVPNDLLTGVAFAGAKSILTATYDTSHLKLWVPE